MTALISGSVIWGGTVVHAEEPNQVFTLDPMIVTATRSEKSDLDTPAAVEVYSQEQLKKTGATNLQEALKFGTGLLYQAQGPRGTSQGTMTSKIIIRGVEKGTLVLVDGVPLNQSGRYNLDDIGLETIDRVEVVRGGGAVLYGSEATGGVVNIITKGTRQNSIRTSFGNYGMQNHAASVQLGKLGLSYSYDKTGAVDDISNPDNGRPEGMYYNTIRGEHNNFNWRYNFNENIYFTHAYGENNSHYVYRYDGRDNPNAAGKDYKNAIHTTKNNMMQLHYDKDGLNAVLYYNNREQETKNKTAKVSASKPNFNPNDTKSEFTKNDDKSMGFDVSKRWDMGINTALLGVSAQKDSLDYSEYKSGEKKSRDYKRNIYAVYGQYGLALSKASTINFNARETWTANATAGQNFSKFVPEIEFLNKINDNNSFYAKAGKSFMLPTFTQVYGSGNIIGNADLKPQHGQHFEVGFKHNINNHAWRLSVFNYTIKDSIESSYEKDGITVKYNNEDVKNTGVELTCDIDAGEGLRFNWGASYSNPQKRSAKDARGDEFVFEKWHDYYGKLQLNGGVSYTKDKFQGSVNLNYLGKRTRDSASEEKMRPQLFTNINLSYKPVKNSRFYLNIDNILDRRDITTSSTSTYYTLGRNFMVGYEYNF